MAAALDHDRGRETGDVTAMRILGSPRRYVQGPGVFCDLATLTAGIGLRPHVGAAVISRFGGEITAAEIPVRPKRCGGDRPASSSASAASNDAPTSRLIVICDDGHRIVEVRRRPCGRSMPVFPTPHWRM